MNTPKTFQSMIKSGLALLMTLPAAATLAAPAGADIGGLWNYSETSVLVLKPADEVIHLSCFLPDGELEINQTGATFTGVLTHYTTECMTKDGFPVPPPWPLPYVATFTGKVTGQAVHIDQYDAPPSPPIHCPKQAILDVVDGQVTGFTTHGRCDLKAMGFPINARNFGEASKP